MLLLIVFIAGEAGLGGLRGGEAFGEHRGVLDRLTAALSQMRAHRMGGVAHQNHGTAGPAPGGGAIVEIVAQQSVGRRGRQDRGPYKDRGSRAGRDDDRRGGHSEGRGEGKRKYK